MITDPIRMCELLVGLPDVNVLSVDDAVLLRVHIELRDPSRCCPDCGQTGGWKERRRVELVDLACFGRPVRLVWHKHRWTCPNPACGRGSWTSQDTRIAPVRGGMTVRAGRWVTIEVGRDGRTVSELARELDCDWHTVNDTVIAYGTALLDADTARIGQVTALGLDETLFARSGAWRTQAWATSIVDVNSGTLLDMVPGCDSTGAARWIEAMSTDWTARVRYGVLDLSGPYRAVFNTALSHVTQIADPFHLIRLANDKLDECRRRVQNETLGHRGRADDPLYRVRKLLVMAEQRVDDGGRKRIPVCSKRATLEARSRPPGMPRKKSHTFHQIDDPDIAAGFVAQLGHDLGDQSCPPEFNQLGRTIIRWHAQITAWHQARVSNGPTEAVNNLIKRVKRVEFGFRRFSTYRIRALLTPADPTGTSSPPSAPTEIRRAPFLIFLLRGTHPYGGRFRTVTKEEIQEGSDTGKVVVARTDG